ncbi:tnpGa1 domain protein [Neisseria musculi]|uniref:TnpGa1 domain protein n=1 Tax=Neisseria musculi TaxID=1815583 RepID=A0A7H1M8D4_9NEIS|nr:tnpGa1 domain protein [Neisseria musculi]
MPDGIVCTDCYKSYDVLDVSDFTHHRINLIVPFQNAENSRFPCLSLAAFSFAMTAETAFIQLGWSIKNFIGSRC